MCFSFIYTHTCKIVHFSEVLFVFLYVFLTGAAGGDLLSWTMCAVSFWFCLLSIFLCFLFSLSPLYPFLPLPTCQLWYWSITHKLMWITMKMNKSSRIKRKTKIRNLYKIPIAPLFKSNVLVQQHSDHVSDCECCRTRQV